MSEDGWFGEEVAEMYDDENPSLGTAPMFAAELDILTSLAGDGRALEFAIGTGRVAIPLRARGVLVAGIELSRAMVSRMRAKPGGEEAAIQVVIGDMTTAVMPGAGEFTLVYLVFNTVMNIVTQDGQVACFQNAARHLAPGGSFLVETSVPSLRLLPPGQRYVTFDRTDSHVGVDEYEVARQGMRSHHLNVDADGRARQSSVPFRYVWPAELDLMARLAGLGPRSRWEDWLATPFGNESRSHVSIWTKPRP